MVHCASLILLGVLVCAPPGVAATLERSISTSRQFLVYGPDIGLRSAICDVAERTKSDLLRRIGRRDEWATPIVIHAQYRQANLPETPRANLNLSQTGCGLKLQLDLIIAPDVAHSEIQRELLGALLLEIRYRGAPDLSAGTTYVPPPDWLLDGLRPHASDRMSGNWATLAAAHKILPLEEFLRQRPGLLDASGRSLYGAYSVALVEFLTQMSNGQQRLARFISALPSASKDALADLRIHFPEIDAVGGSRNTWISHLARLAARPSYRSLSGPETERVLNEKLKVRISIAGSEKEYRLHEFRAFIREPAARPALTRLDRELSALVGRANSIYRPVIYEYEKVAARLARGKTHGIAERLAGLAASRKRIANQMRRVDDYMNWFEVTQPREPSGAFADYMRSADSGMRSQRRRDPISVYVDVLEVQFQD